MPKRIQRKRTNGWRTPEGAVYVGRPTIWGNPWRIRYIPPSENFRPGYWVVQDHHRTWYPSSRRVAQRFAVWMYRRWARNQFVQHRYRLPLSKLRGRDVLCWCKLDAPCHADVLLELANQALPE